MKFAGKSRCAHGLPSSWRSDKEELPTRLKTIFEQPFSLSLLDQNALEPFGQQHGQNHVSEPERGGLDGEKISKLPSRLKDNELSLSALYGGRPAFGFFDKFTKLLRDSSMAQFRLVSGSLHSDGQEFPIVPFEVTLQERDHVAS